MPQPRNFCLSDTDFIRNQSLDPSSTSFNMFQKSVKACPAPWSSWSWSFRALSVLSFHEDVDGDGMSWHVVSAEALGTKVSPCWVSGLGDPSSSQSLRRNGATAQRRNGARQNIAAWPSAVLWALKAFGTVCI